MGPNKKPPPQPLNALVPRYVTPPAPKAYYVASSPYGFEEDDADQKGGLLEYLHILRRHKKAIFISALIGLTLGFAAGIPLKPIYRAHTSLEVLSLNQDFMNMKQSSPVTTTSDSYLTSPKSKPKLSSFKVTLS